MSTIMGDHNNNDLVGTTGNDSIAGLNGNDTINGVEGNDSIDAGDGNDSIADSSGAGNDTIFAGLGNDTVDARYGSHVIDGGAGNDQFLDLNFGASSFAETFTGGPGRDFYFGSNSGVNTAVTEVITDFTTGAGGDVLDLTAYLNILSGRPTDANPFAAGFFRLLQSGPDTLFQIDFNGPMTGGAVWSPLINFKNTTATSFTTDNFLSPNDYNPQAETGALFTGDANDNSLTGGVNADTLIGNDGNDTLVGGFGNDCLDGGSGNDDLECRNGHSGIDTLLGGAGDDYLQALQGTNSLDGGPGNDIFDDVSLNFQSVGGSDTIQGGTGRDTYSIHPVFSAPAIPDTIIDFTTGADGDVIDLTNLLGSELVGWAKGTNPFTTGFIQLTQNGLDTLLQVDPNGATGGADFVTVLTLQNTTAANVTSVNFVAGQNTAGGASSSITLLPGDAGANTIIGGEGRDSIPGGGGGDSILGNSGSDNLTETGSGNDTLLGGDGNDSIMAADGHDSVDGGDGDDSITGGSSTADGGTFLGGAGHDTIIGSGGPDSISGGPGNDSIPTSNGNDTFDGGAGNDTFDDFLGVNWIDGGDGNDSFLNVSLPGRVAGETLHGGDGQDKYSLATTANQTTIPDVVTDFQVADDSILMSNLFNVLPAYDSTTNPFATGFFRLLQSGLDTQLQLDQNGAAGGVSFTTILTLQNTTADNFTASNFVSNTGLHWNPQRTTGISISGDADGNSLSGDADNDTILGLAGDDCLFGNNGADTIDAGDGEDSLLGGENDDTLNGGGDNDTLIGGKGNDSLDGGADSDTAVFSSTRANYLISQNGSTFTVQDNRFGAPDGTEQVTNVELFQFSDGTFAADNLINQGPSQLSDINASPNSVSEGAANGSAVGITASSSSPIGSTLTYSLLDDAGGRFAINSATGVVTVANGTLLDYETATSHDITVRVTDTANEHADQTFFIRVTNVVGVSITGNSSANLIHATNEDDSINGASGNDTIDALSGNDTITGGAGSDSMIGGVGNDLYTVDASGDKLLENLNEGIDSVQSSVSYTLYANVEVLTLTGIANLNATGNGADNSLTGNSGNNILAGLGGADALDGDAGTDTATYAASQLGVNVSLTTGTGSGGDAAGDSLANIENLTGSNFNDTLEGDGGDNVLAGGNGTDTVSYAHAGAGITFNLSITSAQNTVGAGTDTVTKFENLTGSAFNDSLTGSTANNVLMGLDGNDTLSDNGGNDTLDGGTGADSMAGGGSNDVYVVDNAGDMVNEASGGGTDTIQTAFNVYSLALIPNVENLTFVGAGGFTGSGNGLNNSLTGGSGNDTLDGGTGNDTLDGGAGADSMIGGTGNDTFIVDGGDTVAEAAGGGTDTVKTILASYTLGANLENLSFTGAGNFAGTGNTLNNTITGGTGNDTLDGGSGNDKLIAGAGDDQLAGSAGNDSLTGGAGADTLTGGIGADKFIFTNLSDFASGPTFDTIADFTHAQSDKIDLSGVDAIDNSIDGGANGTFIFINSAAFSGTGAASAGQLRYVVNGSGGVNVEGDTDGDGVADFSFVVNGAASLAGTDFVL